MMLQRAIFVAVSWLLGAVMMSSHVVVSTVSGLMCTGILPLLNVSVSLHILHSFRCWIQACTKALWVSVILLYGNTICGLS